LQLDQAKPTRSARSIGTNGDLAHVAKHTGRIETLIHQ